jgi:hypothetical protein
MSVHTALGITGIGLSDHICHTTHKRSHLSCFLRSGRVLCCDGGSRQRHVEELVEV